jgi:hypothetical protein
MLNAKVAPLTTVKLVHKVKLFLTIKHRLMKISVQLHALLAVLLGIGDPHVISI